MTPSLGVMYRPNWAPEAMPEFARAVEAMGYRELWLPEDCFFAGAFGVAALALAATSELVVGIGILPVAVRNPVITAMDLSGLARAYPGRLKVAFGHGVDAFMRRIGARPANRLVALEETVDVVRRLLAGERVSVAGQYVTADDVLLTHVPEVAPPVLIGTTGPRALEIAGRVADGVVLPEGITPDAIRWALDAYGGGGEAVVYAWLSVDGDRDAAAEALRPDIEHWRAMDIYPQLYEFAGLADASAAIDDEQIRGLGVVGSPEDCAAGVRAFEAAGATSLILWPLDSDPLPQLERFAGTVLPLLGA